MTVAVFADKLLAPKPLAETENPKWPAIPK